MMIAEPIPHMQQPRRIARPRRLMGDALGRQLEIKIRREKGHQSTR
jgi:hypothetical protein